MMRRAILPDLGPSWHADLCAAMRVQRDRCPPAVKAWAARFFPTPAPAGHPAPRGAVQTDASLASPAVERSAAGALSLITDKEA